MRIAALLFVALSASASAQVDGVPDGFTASASVDQETYAYGETITFRYTLTNTTGMRQQGYGPSSGFVGITYGSLALPEVVTADGRPYVFDAGQSQTWVWVLRPEDLGVPEADGTQTIWGHVGVNWGDEPGQPGDPEAMQLAVPVTFEAPRYLGGPLLVGFPAANVDTVAALRGAVQATLAESYDQGNGTLIETWQVDGIALAEAIQILDGNGTITSVERSILSVSGFLTAAEYAAATATVITPPSPNPSVASATFTVRLGAPEAVTVDLLDARGRRMAVLHDGPLAAGLDHPFTVASTALPTGVYVVRVTGPTVRKTQRVTVSR